MSFGITDRYWVEPDPEPEIECRDCEHWEECPCKCGWGFCDYQDVFTEEDDTCS